MPDPVAGSCGADPILSTQRIPRGRDRILSTQRIPRGRDPDGGDVDDNGCFLQVKAFLHWPKIKMGAMLMKMAVLHKENAFCVGLLGAIHKKMNYILKTFPCCARGLYHLIEIGGTIWRKMPIFKQDNWALLSIFYEKIPRMVRNICLKAILSKIAFLKGNQSRMVTEFHMGAT